MTRRLSDGTVSSPQIMIFIVLEKIITSGLREVCTPVQGGKFSELSMSTRSSQSLARLNNEDCFVGFFRVSFVFALTKETEI